MRKRKGKDEKSEDGETMLMLAHKRTNAQTHNCDDKEEIRSKQGDRRHSTNV
jgi:hypothetical protein